MAPPAANAIEEVLRPLTDAPERAALFLDIDGVLAPIVERAEDAHVPERSSRLIARIARRYRCVGCVSGRAAADARRLVGVAGIAYAGSHGVELLDPNASEPRMAPAVAEAAGGVRSFAERRTRDRELPLLRVRVEDKGAIFAFHWRGAPDEDAAHRYVLGLAADAEDAGLHTHWGRKVLELRPPVPIDKGQAVLALARRCEAGAALFAGDDTTDLDGFAALDTLVAEGSLTASVRVGVRSEEGPREIVERADLVVDGVEGFAAVLAVLAGEER